MERAARCECEPHLEKVDGQTYKGNHITTMTYDFWAGRSGNQWDGTRFTLQEIFLSTLPHILYDDGRDPPGEPSWWGLQKKQALSTFNNHIEILAMIEDTNDGEFFAVPPSGGAVRPNAGPVWEGLFNYNLSEQTVCAREAANSAIAEAMSTSAVGSATAMSSPFLPADFESQMNPASPRG